MGKSDNNINLASEIRTNVSPGNDFEEFDASIIKGKKLDAKVIAFYLPQFYSFPENDEWWGKGFTEWTNVSKAIPRFSGHYQPRIPRDLGFYNQTSENTIRKQIELAASSGLHGFCFYYYWFNKKRLLDKPLDIFANLDDSSFPFCLMWANENWTRSWDGLQNDVLLQQDYIDSDEDALLKDLNNYFANDKYIKVNGRPIFIIYRPGLIPAAKETFKRWRKKWKLNHTVEPYILMVQGFGDFDPDVFGLDGAIEFPPHKLCLQASKIPNENLLVFDSDFKGLVTKYKQVISRSLSEKPPSYPLIKTAIPSWDNDARREGKGHTILGSTPKKYQYWLRKLIKYSKENTFYGESLVFINAWNEWAEAAYLEPDIHYGSAYLNATARAITNTKEKGISMDQYLTIQKKLDKIKNELLKNTSELEEANNELDKTKKELIQIKSELNNKNSELEKVSVTIKVLQKEEITSKERELKLKTKLNKTFSQLETIKSENSNLISQAKQAENLFTEILTNKDRQKVLNKIVPKFTLGCLFSKSKRRLLKDKQQILESGLFSPLYYLTHNPDVAKANVNPLNHFLKFGWKEGRNPSEHFDCSYYLKNNPDVNSSGGNPLIHFIRYGSKERRAISPKSTVVLDRYIELASPKNFNIEQKVESSTITALLKKNITANEYTQNIIKKATILINRHPLKVSVVMPTWNREKSICLAIDSVLQQSYLPYELIISDDGSTDNTVKIIKKKYKKELTSGLIKLIINNHSGVSSARNSALEQVQGDVIAYLDSDNQWRKHYLMVMASILSENDEVNCAYSALFRHNNNNDKKDVLLSNYDRKNLLTENFIDLNVFIHRSFLYQQFGGFDTTLKRLVDWDFIIRYTKNYTPAVVPFVGVDYFLDNKHLKNITTTVSLDGIFSKIYHKNFSERIKLGLDELRIAYVLWDFPALSQTFVMEEIKWLVKQGYDVVVYFSIEPDKAAILDFEVDSYQVKDAEQLTALLQEHQRNFCHSHFAYPTATKLTYPACVKVNIPFTFMPHAVDIFHNENKKRNKIGEISRHPLCKKVLVHGEFHKRFIEECGVPSEKIAFNIQAVNVADFAKKGGALRLRSAEQPYSKRNTSNNNEVLQGVLITRFVEKKGISTLIDAAALLKNENIVFDIYGYGPLEDDYKKQIKALGVDNVILKGALNNQQDVAKAYQGSDFLITPCVIAENGDMDGFPTVILEAMAMGLPVITTDIAAIPDYLTDGVEALVAPAGNSEKLAEYVLKLKAMSPQRIAAMVKRSQQFLDKKIGVKQTMQMLLDTWQGYTLEIFLVTFNTEKYEDSAETFEIIKRIFKYTTTPFTLTIIDNNSDEEFWLELCEQVGIYPNVRLIRKTQNLYCGPSSNIALELSDSEFGIYICSKEGFIKSHGWERPLLEHMRNNPNDALAGHHAQMPKYIYGKEYLNHPDFAKFRNPEFAQENPERVFKHVQGGVFIIRRDFVAKHGGFNPATPHGGMDIEMSYYAESLGYGLGDIPEVASITVKTLPKLQTILTERTVVAHPLTIKNVNTQLDSIEKNKGQTCNMCGWKGSTFINVENQGIQTLKCPKCSSTSFGRSLVRLLANNHHIYRKEKALVLSDDKSLKKFIEPFFDSLLITNDAELFYSTLKLSQKKLDLIIIDFSFIKEKPELWKNIIKSLSPIGEVIFTDSFFVDSEKTKPADSLNTSLNIAFSATAQRYLINYTNISSFCIGYDWRRLGVINFYDE
ncbi:MAG: glycoside hydrolase family 99-like domain-containing protein [Methylococcaceae bacterium]|nr:glycoside hydrolase family 99-like domain-containing protein [Methylococcaceae bacterium]